MHELNLCTVNFCTFSLGLRRLILFPVAVPVISILNVKFNLIFTSISDDDSTANEMFVYYKEVQTSCTVSIENYRCI